MSSSFDRGIQQRLVSLTSLCIFIQIVLSYPLWLGKDRVYPLLNAIEPLPVEFGYSIQVFLVFGLLLCLLVFTIGFQFRLIVALFFSILLLLIAEDINRLQVWVYQLSIFLLLLFFPFSKKNNEFLNALQIGIIGIYCWSGIHKLNIYFVEDIFPWMMEPLGVGVLVINYPFVAILAAIFEIFLGLGLFFSRSRQITVICAIGFHFLILFILGPLGHDWNMVVWPWNLAMIGLVYLLFYKKNKSILAGLNTEVKNYSWKGAALSLFIILPGFNFFQLWDEQLSFKMYSGHSPEGVFYFKGQEKTCFSERYYEELLHFDYSSQTKRIILDEWAFASLKVAPYKSRYRIIQVGKKLCECVEKTELAGLEILEVQRWNKNKDEFVKIPCNVLLRNPYHQLGNYFKDK